MKSIRSRPSHITFVVSGVARASPADARRRRPAGLLKGGQCEISRREISAARLKCLSSRSAAIVAKPTMAKYRADGRGGIVKAGTLGRKARRPRYERLKRSSAGAHRAKIIASK